MPPLSSTIASAFEDVNQLILENLRSDVSLVEDIGQYISMPAGNDFGLACAFSLQQRSATSQQRTTLSLQ